MSGIYCTDKKYQDFGPKTKNFGGKT